MLKTLAAKHQSTVITMPARHKRQSSPHRTTDLLRVQEDSDGQPDLVA